MVSSIMEIVEQEQPLLPATPATPDLDDLSEVVVDQQVGFTFLLYTKKNNIGHLQTHLSQSPI